MSTQLESMLVILVLMALGLIILAVVYRSLKAALGCIASAVLVAVFIYLLVDRSLIVRVLSALGWH